MMQEMAFKNLWFCFVVFSYLNLQIVVELLTCGRKGLWSAKLKVPELVLCSERNKTTRPKKIKISVFQSEACTVIASLLLCLLYSMSHIYWSYEHIHKNHSIKVDSCLKQELNRKRSANVYHWPKSSISEEHIMWLINHILSTWWI